MPLSALFAGRIVPMAVRILLRPLRVTHAESPRFLRYSAWVFSSEGDG
jgi:hypothetical protein